MDGDTLTHIAVADIFASDLSHIEILGKNARFCLVVKRFGFAGAPGIDAPAANIILPIEIIPAAIARTLFALGESALPRGLLDWSRLLH